MLEAVVLAVAISVPLPLGSTPPTSHGFRLRFLAPIYLPMYIFNFHIFILLNVL